MKTTPEGRAWVRHNAPADEVREFVLMLLDDIDELDGLINTAQTADFLEAVRAEAAHQVLRWGPDDRAIKVDLDWIWLMAYLASKVVFGKENGAARHIADATRDYARWHEQQGHQLPTTEQGNEKYRHRIITIAAAAKNWLDNRGKK